MIDRELIEIKNCVGCFACATICPIECISMISDEEGFWYPIVDYDKCIECRKCLEACPVINTKATKNEPVAYACFNKDEAIRLDSSSGGMFTLFAENIIEKNGIVFGAGFNEEMDVEHILVNTKKDLGKLRGSKYVQSKIGGIYKEIKIFLENGTKVLFSGTPCQVGGLKTFLAKNYGNLLCFDLVCHGVPSPLVWQKYILYKEQMAGSKVKKIFFRNKEKGWKKYSVFFFFENGLEYKTTFNNDLYMKAFLKNICLRPVCYNCMFKGTNRESDITLADFWGIERIYPDIDDDKGISLVLVNSLAGQELFDEIKNKTIFKKVDLNEAIKCNASVIDSVSINSNRNNFFKDLSKKPFAKVVRKYCDGKLTYKAHRKFKLLISFALKKLT